MTRAAYQEAIDWSTTTGFPLGLECDVHFSADDQLICLHDLTIERTSKVKGRAIDLTVEQLKRLDFGARGLGSATPAGQELVTLEELLLMVREARGIGTDVSLVIETKHPNPRGGDVEDRVAAMLTYYGWDRPGSPVRLISFSPTAMERLARQLPGVDRSFLIDTDLAPWRDGHLPPGVAAVGIDLELLRKDPSYVEEALLRGHQVHVWTVNEPADIEFCRDLGVTGFTTDYPERVAVCLATYSSARAA